MAKKQSRRTAEEVRLEASRERTAHWKRWGPYLSDRQWGTVREDYSADGRAWEYFPHEHAHLRAYRWGEDGILGISDRHQLVCFAIALWNGRDPILKERLFGLTNAQGNHGEDVKEEYFFLDATPTHSWMRALYKYPQAAFPYEHLVRENAARGRSRPEFNLRDTGVFDENRYFDVFVEYAKAAVEDVCIRVTVVNRGPERADLTLLPTLWFRNTWSWGDDGPRPELAVDQETGRFAAFRARIERYGDRVLVAAPPDDLLVTGNETNFQALFGTPNPTPYVKDAFHRCVVRGERGAVNPERRGTKGAFLYRLSLDPGESREIRLRLTDAEPRADLLGDSFAQTCEKRAREADAFYTRVAPDRLGDEPRDVQRRAFAGLLWCKQVYHFDVRRWLDGDPGQPKPPQQRQSGRNHDWSHLYNDDVLSMPDAWEYPWYASWDTAFHTIPFALIDPDFAKEQLVLLLREWYMHPNGQIPAYEWAFGDANPPLHAWAAWRVFQIERRLHGKGDREFLERVFHKLLLNFTWWLNRKDPEGRNLFQGGFLGLDNIGVFDRSAPLPTGGHIEQSDGTSWMGMYCLNMLAIALELAHGDPAYGDIASKFFEHFIHIASAMNHFGGEAISLWDEEDGFYYDVLHLPDGRHEWMKIRSMVGLIPLFASFTLEPEVLEPLHGFRRRMQWFLDNHPAAARHVETLDAPGRGPRRLLALVNRDRLLRVLSRTLDENEFLSPHGVRALSKHHLEHPYRFSVHDVEHSVRYDPGESTTPDFGGNSNWRGPVWFPLNFLLIEALQRHHHFYGDDLLVEFPTGSGRRATLWDVSRDLSRRLIGLFLRGPDGGRPADGGDPRYRDDPNWRDLRLFHEYFHGDDGRGLGASHQTGWTALVAKLIDQSGAD